MHLDHVTIRTRDLRATRSLFLTVFDLEEGKRPLAIRRIVVARSPGRLAMSVAGIHPFELAPTTHPIARCSN
jgi:catechol 2,3-dioxygenase-like lactoylglutathione lyase family enzyme